MRDIAGIFGTRHLGEEHGELVASEAGNVARCTLRTASHDVRGSDLCLQRPRHAPEKGIAGPVAERVVHPLEPVEVEIEKRRLLTRALRAVEDPVHGLHELGPTRQSRQGIAAGIAEGTLRLIRCPRSFARPLQCRANSKREDFGGCGLLREARDAQVECALGGFHVAWGDQEEGRGIRRSLVADGRAGAESL
jgi:hypothetical protein